MIAKTDDITGYIQEKLIENNLENRVNVIHLSDHGMNNVTPDNFISLTEFSNGMYDTYGSSPVIQIVPVDPSECTWILNMNEIYQMFQFKGKRDEIFVNLTKAAEKNGHFKIYNKHNLPARWHANNAKRLGPILAVADIGYGFKDLLQFAQISEQTHHIKGIEHLFLLFS